MIIKPASRQDAPAPPTPGRRVARYVAGTVLFGIAELAGKVALCADAIRFYAEHAETRCVKHAFRFRKPRPWGSRL